ncbi:glycosyltransferase [Granulosicoccus antarcticus]|uniref:Putative glycosyltransferase n=1 Tax=Granulosicoccus antarcticus IMCC3135 TaxID=1192854 RepID=A0A2Z2NTQ5_9GAMM|nr:glycosyltransferase [Granulosicoccus antarcticus]ASJ72140.1 putative glycosyltransferase [Granulosicoccus antarcticus IMCC3135]
MTVNTRHEIVQFSLIIPAWNEADFIAQTLESVTSVLAELERHSAHRGELIVVDNNSTDATAQIAESYGAKVVFEPVNQIARARNCGAQAACGEVLIFLDADTRCSERLLNHVLDRLQTGTVVGGGSTIAPDKPISTAAMRGMSAWNAISRTANLAAGCFIFCTREAFEAIGGFSDKVYAGEEIFLSRALKRWGRARAMRFEIMTIEPVVTSVRKLEWYSPMQLALQTLLVLIPGALFSKRLCSTWYDKRKHGRRSGPKH